MGSYEDLLLDSQNKTNLFLHHSPLTKREATKTALPKSVPHVTQLSLEASSVCKTYQLWPPPSTSQLQVLSHEVIQFKDKKLQTSETHLINHELIFKKDAQYKSTNTYIMFLGMLKYIR